MDNKEKDEDAEEDKSITIVEYEDKHTYSNDYE